MESIYKRRDIERFNILLIESLIANHSVGTENTKWFGNNFCSGFYTSVIYSPLEVVSHHISSSLRFAGLDSSLMDLGDIGLDANASTGGVCSRYIQIIALE